MIATKNRDAERSGAPVGERAGKFSVAGRVALVFGLVLAGQTALIAVAVGLLPLTPLEGVLASLAVGLPVGLWALNRALRPLRHTLGALSDGIRSFSDRDFSVRIARTGESELDELIGLYNRVSGTLQEERGAIRQRELLLQSALDRSPTAILLVNALDRIVYANEEARRLFLGEGRLEGLGFREIVERCPPEMRRVMDGGEDGIFTVESDGGESETYHLAQRDFYLNRQRHTLCMLRRLTAELGRQEAEIWKKVIRVISHELNNSLAPISSLAHSAMVLAEQGAEPERLEPIFTSIRERLEYLKRFLDGYARFARLPRPEKQRVLRPSAAAGKAARRLEGVPGRRAQAVHLRAGRRPAARARLVRSLAAPAGDDQPAEERRRGQ
jgi:nitrogen fixation/metabolism regulation signal transduction histidine kinase